MRIEQATEHAREVAREVVQQGLAERGVVRQLYHDYAQTLQGQVEAESFADVLLARGVIDQASHHRLLERFPLPAAGSGFFPAHVIPPSGDGPSMTRADDARDRTPDPASSSSWRDPPTRPAPPRRELDLESSARMRRSALPASFGEKAPVPELTMAYEDVLPAPTVEDSKPGLAEPARSAAPDGTASFEGVLETPPPGWERISDSSAGAERPIVPGFDTTTSEPGERSARTLVESSEEATRPRLEVASDGGEGEAAFYAQDPHVPDAPLREPEPGEVMGDYQLERVLGRGGMGVIYLAKKIGTENRVALKALTVGSGEGGSKRRARFQREVDALRRLQHPNIVKIHGCGRKGPWDWYAMDFVDGQELKALIKEGKLGRPERLQVFNDICAAVHHAHERGVIHRDLKPANILITHDLQVRVLDFGLAKLADGEMELTRTGAALGTPYYMAPEQLLSPKDVDARSDVFSLGVLLYEMLVGERPFTGETAGEVGNKIMSSDPVRPSKVNPSLHTQIDAIVMKALAKDPAYRYQDAEALRRDVAKFRRGSSLRSMTDVDAAGEFVRRWLNQNKVPVAVGFLLASVVYWPVMFVIYAFM